MFIISLGFVSYLHSQLGVKGFAVLWAFFFFASRLSKNIWSLRCPIRKQASPNLIPSNEFSKISSFLYELKMEEKPVNVKQKVKSILWYPADRNRSTFLDPVRDFFFQVNYKPFKIGSMRPYGESYAV